MLGINGGSHDDMIGRMLIDIERVLLQKKPDCVNGVWIYQFDTGWCTGGGQAEYPGSAIEAGLLSFDMRMSEEIDRVFTDQVSDILFCPSPKRRYNLA